MRLAVHGEGYSGAVGAFVGGNLLAASTCSTLADRLAGSAGMAGDDASAAEFAASYDEAASEAIAALADLVGAFGSLGHLAQASLANHAAAEVASGGRSVTAPPTRADDSVGVLVAVPPTSLGGDSPSLPGPAAWVLDQIEGVVWPDADTDRLRVAADTWRSAAESVAMLTSYCDEALEAFYDELSPEVPLAVATTQQLRSRVDTLASQLGAIGGACAAYADHVDAKRGEMLDLLQQVAVELGVGALVGIGLGILSAGLATGAAGAAGSARLAWAARELKAIVDSLRIVTGGPALELRTAGVSAREVGAFGARISSARVLTMEASASGAARFGAGSGGLLGRSEGPGRGHTIERHVGKSVDYLLARVRRHPTATHASTYLDEAGAERALEALLRRKASDIEAWLRSAKKEERFEDVLRDPTGISVNRAGEVLEVRGVRAILVRDQSMPEGYWVKTSFPQP